MGTDPAAKLSARLTSRLDSVSGSSPVEVIVELRPVAMPEHGSRSERIEAAKAEFEQELRGVEQTITAVGGHVIETAWINQVVRSSIPAAAVHRVAEDDDVAAIDLPRMLSAEGHS